MYRLFFRLDHRIGRAKFWLGFLVVEAVFIAGDWALGEWLLGLNPYDLDVSPEQRADQRYLWGTAGLSMVLLYPSFAVLLKRCHDRNKGFRWLVPWLVSEVAFSFFESTGFAFSTTDPSGIVNWTEWTLLISGLLLYAWIIIDLGILSGTKGTNLFGPDPRNKAG